MAGRGAGGSAFAWRWCADVVPPAPPKRGRGMPHAPLRKIWTTWLEVWLPGCRWGAKSDHERFVHAYLRPSLGSVR